MFINDWTYRTWKDKLYWAWRFSIVGQLFYKVKGFIHLQIHARQIAIALDNSLRQFGQMNHSNHEPGFMLMKNETRSSLVQKGYKALPNGYRWRKD